MLWRAAAAIAPDRPTSPTGSHSVNFSDPDSETSPARSHSDTATRHGVGRRDREGSRQRAGEAATTGAHPRVWPDPLYGEVRLAAWAADLAATPPFTRLAGISLSDVPGEMLFERPFPSRLDHARGVYHLARLARPRDRALQAAALAHDLGHGPFSHLCEPIMRTVLGVDHEHRAARLLAEARTALSAAAARHLAWLDWDEVADLIVGGGADGRGALLSGPLDYDNADNLARFLTASGLGAPEYAPEELARALRPLPAAPDTPDGDRPRSCLIDTGEDAARAWLDARVRVYGYLQASHRNLAPHSMLRKAIELAYTAGALPADFFDLTNAQAFVALAGSSSTGAAALAGGARAGADHWHVCVWEGEVPIPAHALRDLLGDWRSRLVLEAELASEAGLTALDVTLSSPVSRLGRVLPPLVPVGRAGASHSPPNALPIAPRALPTPLPPPRRIHVFAAAGTPRDYVRRLRRAAERRLGALGAHPAFDEGPDQA